MSIESQYEDTAERYRTLTMYGFPTPPEEVDMVALLASRFLFLLNSPIFTLTLVGTLYLFVLSKWTKDWCL